MMFLDDDDVEDVVHPMVIRIGFVHEEERGDDENEDDLARAASSTEVMHHR